MKYLSTRNHQLSHSFKQAVITGLAPDGGLYLPQSIPKLPASFFSQIPKLSRHEIAEKVLWPYVSDSLSQDDLTEIIKEAINFPTPLKQLEDAQYCLELFHGPTKAFKDVGARFMARCLSKLVDQSSKKLHILVATSGDTGSAVANGFYKVPGIQVHVLFPKDKVSPYQEQQMCSLGENIQALEVDGTFDDCQNLVKQAFADEALRNQQNISSANSINIARLLPQMLYYFFAYQEIQKQLSGNNLVISVPSGNLGNLCAGLVAKQMGLPVKRFIAGLNSNRIFLDYLQGSKYQPSKSIQTYANAMDVGKPSNFERILHLYQNDLELIRKELQAFSYSNQQILEEILTCKDKCNYLLDPHTAIAKRSLNESLSEDEIGVFVSTAAPVKFSEVIQKVIPDFKTESLDASKNSKRSMSSNYQDFHQYLLSS